MWIVLFLWYCLFFWCDMNEAENYSNKSSFLWKKVCRRSFMNELLEFFEEWKQHRQAHYPKTSDHDERKENNRRKDTFMESRWKVETHGEWVYSGSEKEIGVLRKLEIQIRKTSSQHERHAVRSSEYGERQKNSRQSTHSWGADEEWKHTRAYTQDWEGVISGSEKEVVATRTWKLETWKTTIEEEAVMCVEQDLSTAATCLNDD
jgi:hypothetical protein